MERKIGETFEYKGIKLITVQSPMGSCFGCYFRDKFDECKCFGVDTGHCSCAFRSDLEYVIFKLVK